MWVMALRKAWMCGQERSEGREQQCGGRGHWGSLDALLGVWGGVGQCIEMSPESRRCLKAPWRAEVGALRQVLRSVTRSRSARIQQVRQQSSGTEHK